MSTQTPLQGLDIGRQLRETATPFQRFHALFVGNQVVEAAAAFRLLTARLEESQRAPYWVAQASRRHRRAPGTPGRRSTARRA